MKLAKVTFMLATVALLGAGCSEQGGSGSSKLIEKPQVTVENGAFTPEVLNANDITLVSQHPMTYHYHN